MIRKPPIRHIEKLKNWIETYPKFNSDGFFQILEYMPLPYKSSNTLEPTKTSSTIHQDIVGEISVTRNLYLTLHARKFNIIDFTSEDIVEFLTDFQHWAIEEQILGNIPKFGNVDTDGELFEIVGALRWQDANEPLGTEDYIWQLHLQYKLTYKEE